MAKMNKKKRKKNNKGVSIPFEIDSFTVVFFFFLILHNASRMIFNCETKIQFLFFFCFHATYVYFGAQKLMKWDHKVKWDERFFFQREQKKNAQVMMSLVQITDDKKQKKKKKRNEKRYRHSNKCANILILFSFEEEATRLILKSNPRH